MKKLTFIEKKRKNTLGQFCDLYLVVGGGLVKKKISMYLVLDVLSYLLNGVCTQIWPGCTLFTVPLVLCHIFFFFWYVGALAFDVEYSRWLEEHNRLINELRAAVNSHAGDTELRTIVDNVTAQFDDIFRLKGIAAKADVFHILSGMWKTPAERCFLWIGGFRSSEILKVINALYIYM